MEREDISASDRIRCDELAQKAEAWLDSKDGRERIQASLRDAREFAERIRKARRVDPSKLTQPMTI